MLVSSLKDLTNIEEPLDRILLLALATEGNIICKIASPLGFLIVWEERASAFIAIRGGAPDEMFEKLNETARSHCTVCD